MVERIEWNGYRYRRYPESKHLSDARYFRRTYNGGSSFLHRDMWEHHHGPIPEGMEIHHVNGDTTDNRLENLQCLSSREHSAKHPVWGGRRDEQREHLERIRPKAAAWHSTAEGAELHKRLARKLREGWEPRQKKCEHCAGDFATRTVGHHDRFCSNACKSAWRRASGVDDEGRDCACCGAQFTANRFSKTRFCSRACAVRSRSGNS